MRASNTAELVFEGVTVHSATHLVGNEGDAMLHMVRKFGRGYRKHVYLVLRCASQMRNLELERLGLAAMALGIARRSIEVRCQHLVNVLKMTHAQNDFAGHE